MQLLKSENQKSNILPLFALGTLGLHLLCLLVLMFHWSILQRLNRQSSLPSLVQLSDGRSLTVNPQSHWQRYPQTIRRFVGETLTLMLTWSPQQPPDAVWDASSQLLSADLQGRFQSEFKSLVKGGDGKNFNSSSESVLVIQTISQPQELAVGRWVLQVVGHQLVFDGSDRLGVSVPFSKRVFVRAVDDFAVAPGNHSRELLAVFRLAQSRLQFYHLCDLHDISCSDFSP